MIVPVSLFCVSYDILYVNMPASYAVRQFFVCCYMFIYLHITTHKEFK